MANDVKTVDVLLVEDDEDDALIVTRLLNKMSRFATRIHRESNLELALAHCQDQDYDAIFVDYYWGHQTLGEMLRHGRVQGLPIIAMTTTDDFTVNQQVIEAGAWDFITKPEMTPALLERTILHAIERRRHEQELHHLVRQDALTGLGNRMMFEEQLKRAISRADRHHSQCAVVALDLDDFKQINDSLGHNVGDLMLQVVADRFKRELRNEDTLARLGGDEFAVLLEGFDSVNQIRTVATKLLQSLRKPMPIRGISGRVTGSAGVALYPHHARSPLEIMRFADIALYASKDEGRDRVSLFDDELEETLLHSLELEQDLRRALDENEFVPYFQPRLDSRDQSLAAVEVLMRWDHPRRGILHPGHFIPMAERANLMLEMDRSLIRTTLSSLAAAGALPNPDQPYRIAFNITVAQLLDQSFANDMQQLVEHYGLSTEQVELEIVERGLVDRVAQESLRALRSAGFGLAIDDFGTGYSSFAYLRELPVTCLKIDGAFVRDIHQDRASEGICEAIVCVGQRLGLSVVGECVERDDQLEVLRKLGVDSIQGFLMARPMDLDHWIQYIHRLPGLEASGE